MEALLGSTLVNHAGEKLDTTKALAGAKLIGVYFSAWVQNDAPNGVLCE